MPWIISTLRRGSGRATGGQGGGREAFDHEEAREVGYSYTFPYLFADSWPKSRGPVAGRDLKAAVDALLAGKAVPNYFGG